MKKKILMMFALALFVVQAKADLAPTVMLRHNGVSTFYKYYEIQKAVDASADGDTIYLTDGTYRPFNIDKRIMVRGTGLGTVIEGDCEIDISGTAKLTMPVLDAVSFNGDVRVVNAYKQFTIRKCSMTNLFFDGADHYDVKVTQCYFEKRFNLTNNVHEINVFNSKISVLYPHDYKAGQATFEHCNIYEICDTIEGGVFNSCAMYQTTKFSGAATRVNLLGCVLNSCAFYNTFNGNYSYGNLCGYNCNTINCGIVSSSDWLNFNNSNSISALDGTKVGAYGGQHPYNRNPEVPRVSKYQLGIDPTTKKMRVNLTVTKP